MRPAAILLGLNVVHGVAAHCQSVPRQRAAPPNAPATVVVRSADVELSYHGATILRAHVSSTGAAPRLRMLVDSSGGKITQVVSWTVGDDRVTLRGTIHATRDAFAADADPREDAVPIVRHSVGPSYNDGRNVQYIGSQASCC